MEMDQKTIIIIVIVVIVIFVLFLLSKMGSPSSKLRKGVVAPKMKIPINTFPITNALQSIVGQNLNIFPMEENKPPKVIKIEGLVIGNNVNGTQTSSIIVSDGMDFGEGTPPMVVLALHPQFL